MRPPPGPRRIAPLPARIAPLPAWLLAGLVGCECAYLGMAHLQDLRRHAIGFLAWFGLAFVFYSVMVAALRWADSSSLRSRSAMMVLVLGAVLFRLSLAWLTPTLSDDVYRYVWDARVQQAGINPYRYAPNDEALRWLRDAGWQSINHKDIATIYPPLMQLAFRAGWHVWPTPLGQKVVFLACDLLIVALLPWLLAREGRHPLWSLLYAWHPLVIVEVAGSGHNDPLGVAWMLVGLGLWSLSQRLPATIAFALSWMSKFTTALLLPFYALKARAHMLLLVGIVSVCAWWCLCSPHFQPGMGHYEKPWEFNSSLYSLGLALVHQPLVVRLISGAAIFAFGVWLACRTDDVALYLLRMIQAAILLTPVLEPWYLLWLIPLLCLRPSWIWLGFSGLVMLSYVVLVGSVASGRWSIPTWVLWAEYAPLYGVMLWSAGRRLARLATDAPRRFGGTVKAT